MKIREISIGAVALMPLVYTSSVMFSSTIPRFLFVVACVCVGTLSTLICRLRLKQQESPISFGYIDSAFLGFFIVMIVSSIGAPDSMSSWWSGAGRVTGIILYGIYGAWYFLLRDLARWNVLWGISWGVALVSSVFVIGEYLGAGSSIRTEGLMDNAMILGTYLAPFVCAGLICVSTKNKWLLVGGSVIIALATYTTGTRASLLGIVCGVGVAGLWYGIKSGFFSRVSRVKIALGVIGVCVVLMGGAYGMREQLFGRDTVSTRLLNWGVGVRAFSDHPVLGWGWENYRSAVDVHFNPTISEKSYYETRIDKPHNVPLEMLVTMGIVGFLMYVGVCAAVVYGVIRAYKSGVITQQVSAGLLGVITTLFIQSLFGFDTPQTIMVVVLIGAYVASHDTRSLISNTITRNVLIIGGVFVVLASGFIGSRLIDTTRQLSYVKQAVDTSSARDIQKLHEVFMKSRAHRSGVYEFETWRWFAQSYLLDFANGSRQISDLSARDREVWNSDVKIIEDETRRVLRENNNSALWQTFGGKVWYYLALASGNFTHLDDAKQAFLRALAIAPYRQEPMILLSYVSLQQKNYDEVVSWYIRALAFGNSEELRGAQNIITGELVKNGENGSIIAVLRATAEAFPSADAYAQLAAGYASAGQYDNAREAVSQAIRYDASFEAEAKLFLNSLSQ